eukprot:scaffold1.g5644.t1
MGLNLRRLKSVDFYRKIPTDLSEASVSGAILSVAATVLILFLLGSELTGYMRVESESTLIVDRSAHGELLRINFNISFPTLSCEFATLDVSDAMGLKRLNLTKTVRKLPITEDLVRAGVYVDDVAHADPKYDEEHPGFQYEDVNLSIPLTSENFEATLKLYDVVVVNFFAPWCPWCQRLAPTWEAATEAVHAKYPETDGRIRFAKVRGQSLEAPRRRRLRSGDDVRAVSVLAGAYLPTFYPPCPLHPTPTYRKGSDEVERNGRKEHESYYGNRTKHALTLLADSLAESAGLPHSQTPPGVQKATKSPGCNFAGFVLVKKVPGTLHFVARAPGHSFDYVNMNLSHVVHYFTFGNKPSPRRRASLAALHPLGLSEDWADKLREQGFSSSNNGATYEHYMQVVLTSIQPRGRHESWFDAYEYTVHSHTYGAEEHSSAKFTYSMSPIQIVVTERAKPLYHFLTAICAVIGGVFTVMGIIDGMVHQVNKITKKMELGKQG